MGDWRGAPLMGCIALENERAELLSLIAKTVESLPKIIAFEILSRTLVLYRLCYERCDSVFSKRNLKLETMFNSCLSNTLKIAKNMSTRCKM